MDVRTLRLSELERQKDSLNMACHEDKYTIDTVAAFATSIRQHVRYSLGKKWGKLSDRDLFMAIALTVRDWMVDRMLATEERYQKVQAKRLYYLSMEYLIGRSLANNLSNLGLLEQCRETLLEMGVDLEEVRESESDAALGNGGLGRLAACFLDSLATLNMPGYGYGINYEYGLFKQEIDQAIRRKSLIIGLPMVRHGRSSVPTKPVSFPCTVDWNKCRIVPAE